MEQAPITPRKRFKDLRILKGSQSKVARDMGVSELSVRLAETGRMVPSTMMCFKYAVYFGASVDELFPDLKDLAKSHFATSQ